MSMADELRKLQQLRAEGVLTDEEFARAKAAILAPPGSAAPASGNSGTSQLREQLERFKAEVADHADREPLRPVLEAAEDVLIAVCGQDRYRSLVQSAETVAELQADYERARKNDDWDARKHYLDLLLEELESFKRRVAGIEYRG